MATKSKAANVDLNSVFEGAASQFRSLNPNEPGQWPMLPKIVTWALLAVFMVVLGWFFLLSNAHDLLDAERSKEPALKSDYRNKLGQAVNLAELRKQQIESQKLLNFGFQFYDTPRLYEKNQVVSTLPVWKGATNTLKTGFTEDLYLTLPKGIGPKLKVAMEARQPLTAPIALGQTVGTLRLTLDGNAVAEFPLQALEEQLLLAGLRDSQNKTFVLLHHPR